MWKTAYRPGRLMVLGLCLALSACDRSSPTEILGNEVDEAHQAWQDLGVADYRFVVTSVSVFLSTYQEITVENGNVVSTLDSDGTEVGGGFTIEGLWEDILAARDAGQLHRASFDARGVPELVDYGEWEVDGGVLVRIREFEPM